MRPAIEVTDADRETADLHADRIAVLTARVKELEEALSEIATDSNPDWTERRVYPNEVLDDIHTIAVRAYYKGKL